jgi:sulfonate transport system permease protein
MKNRVSYLLSVLALLALWLGVKYGFGISDRYLPSVLSIVWAMQDLGPALFVHTAATLVRAVAGFILGLGFGLSLALVIYRFRLETFFLPTVHALRAVPPVAMIPFFLLWFGFSEVGRYILLALGLGLNVYVASMEIISHVPERDRILFRSFGLNERKFIWTYWLPTIIDRLLPTLRFGLALTMGLVTVAEMLGAQYGLGYLIQTSRATFSLNVIFLAAAILGIITAVGDAILVVWWRQMIYWRR